MTTAIRLRFESNPSEDSELCLHGTPTQNFHIFPCNLSVHVLSLACGGCVRKFKTRQSKYVTIKTVFHRVSKIHELVLLILQATLTSVKRKVRRHQYTPNTVDMHHSHWPMSIQNTHCVLDGHGWVEPPNAVWCIPHLECVFS